MRHRQAPNSLDTAQPAASERSAIPSWDAPPRLSGSSARFSGHPSLSEPPSLRLLRCPLLDPAPLLPDGRGPRLVLPRNTIIIHASSATPFSSRPLPDLRVLPRPSLLVFLLLFLFTVSFTSLINYPGIPSTLIYTLVRSDSTLWRRERERSCPLYIPLVVRSCVFASTNSIPRPSLPSDIRRQWDYFEQHALS